MTPRAASRPAGPAPPTPASEAELTAFLSRADTHGESGPVEQIETHISHVFLVGSRAIKLKKPVRFSYLDYSTPALREAACRAELAVNRRFAPSLYLDVAPITRAADGTLSLAGSGDAVDWVVVMRRFDSAAQLDHVAERGELTDGLARALADHIAALHADAPVRADHGGASGLRRAFQITVENLRLATGPMHEPASSLPSRAVEDWIARAGAALDRHAALLDRRRLQGRVRACHGDLHLRNICLLDGRPTPFDAIEFDASIACIDVLFDFAFLLMDLLARSMEQAASAVFNRYLDRSDEADGLPALPLLLSLRAAIRAQVLAASGGSAAGSYLTLALRLLDPAPARLVAVGGLSGTGKTTLAYRLAPQLGAAPGARVIRSDVLRKRLAGLAPEQKLPLADYTEAAHGAVYQALTQEARTCVEAGHTVIADAVFGASAERDAIQRVARDCGVPFLGLWLEAPSDALVHRVAARTGDASDATEAVVRAQIAGGARPPAADARDWRRIAAGGDPAATERNARAVLEDSQVGRHRSA